MNFIKKRDEWTNTQIIFDIIPIGNKTKVQLKHIGLTPKIECFTDCSKDYKYKMALVGFLAKKGIDYWSEPIPETYYKLYDKAYLEKY